MSPLRLLAIVLLWCGVAAAFWFQLEMRQGPLHRHGRLFGTPVRIQVFDKRPQRFAAAVDQAFQEMARLEALTDARRRDNDLARLSAGTGAMRVAPELLEILDEGLQIGRASGGAFDMTLGRLRALWGFDTSHPRLPAPEEIAAVLADSGPGMLAVAEGRVVKHSAARLDLDGIARGYILDRVARELERAGVGSAALEVGGHVFFIGRRSSPWRVDIRHPRQPGERLATLELPEPAAVVTVGDDERFFLQNGLRYHPLFDPASGMPAGSCQSVTVVSPRAARADALASAAFVLGPEAGLALLRRYPDTWGLIVAADGTVRVSPGWDGRVLQP